jgi:hypothetical protein
MGNSRESAKRSAHLRYHQRKGITNSGCSYCIEEKGLPPEVQLEPEPDSFLAGVSKVSPIPFDSERAKSMVERSRSLEHCATLFNLTPAQFKTELKTIGIDWNFLSTTAPLQLIEDLERAIFAGARRGDPRFVMLLVRCHKLPGWSEADVFPTPSQDPRILEMPTDVSTAADLRQLSDEELSERREALIKVVDQPKRLQNCQNETYSIVNASPQDVAFEQNKQKEPLHLLDPDSDEKVEKSSTFMTVNLD